MPNKPEKLEETPGRFACGAESVGALHGMAARASRAQPQRLAAAALLVFLFSLASFLGCRRQPIDISGAPATPVADAAYAPLDGLAAGSREAQEAQKEWAAKAKLPLEVKTQKTGIVFRLVPPGTFLMGSPADETDRDDEKQHRVTLTKALYLGKYEVTQGQWEAVMGTNPSQNKEAAKLPVQTVIWDDAMAFCGKLTESERGAGRLPAGHEYRLPTESEWEYACRAGTQTAYGFGNEEGKLGDSAWYSSNSGGKMHEVGRKKPNAWGLHDMHGNVWEWCLDWLGDYPAGAATDPVGPRTGSYRVSRGGGWDFNAGYCRAADRRRGGPAGTISYLGFRVALAPSVQR